MVGSATTRAAKVSAGLSRIAESDPSPYARYSYKYAGGTKRPPPSSNEPERVIEAFRAVGHKLEELRSEKRAKRPRKRDVSDDLVFRDLEEGLYRTLRKPGPPSGENLTNALLATMLADLVDTLGTRAFDEINLARLTDKLAGRPSLDEQLLMSAVDIARGELEIARATLDEVSKAKTLGDARLKLVDRYRAVGEFLDPAVDPLAVTYLAKINGFQGQYRALTQEPSEEILSVLTPIDGRVPEYLGRVDSDAVQEVLDASYNVPGEALTKYDLMGGASEASLYASLNSIRAAVRRKDLETALGEVDEIRAFYSARTEPLSARDEWAIERALQDLEDASRVLVRRFVPEDEPFFTTIRENFFAVGRSFDELPAPLASFARRLRAQVDNFDNNTPDAVRRPVVLSLNRFFNAVLDGEEATVTNKLGEKYFRALNETRGSKIQGTDAFLADAQRLAALFRKGKEAVGAMNANFVPPRVSDEVNELADSLGMQVLGRVAKREALAPTRPNVKVRVNNTRPAEVRARLDVDSLKALDELERSARRLPLQPGYRQEDLIDLGTEMIVIAERGEDVDAAYDRLIRPVLAFPQRGLVERDRLHASGGRFIDQLREISSKAQKSRSAQSSSRGVRP